MAGIYEELGLDKILDELSRHGDRSNNGDRSDSGEKTVVGNVEDVKRG
jgi:hypothetical protein